MFDKQKMKELEQRSHNRGLLSKQFYLSQQQQLQKKRREMKAELDRQVQERRRVKQLQKLQNQRRIRKEQEQIKMYYKNLESRDKRISANESSAMQASNMKQAAQPYQTYPVEAQNQSRQKGISLNKSKAGQSKAYIVNDGDMPLMPAMPFQYEKNGQSGFKESQQQGSVLVMSKQSIQNIGNIPLLSLSEDSNPVMAKAKKGKQKTTKREKTLEAIKESQQKVQQSQSRQVINPVSFNLRQQRRSTIPDQQSIFGSIVHANNIMEKPQAENEIPQELYQVQQQNKSLKVQLKKKQEALSLLIGAVRSNGKLDKYRVQAQKILHGNESSSKRSEQKQQDRNNTMLPKIYMRHQSIMHDYLLSAARRNKKGNYM